MGRITIFMESKWNSVECEQVKTALEERSIPFVCIDISSFPEKRKDMVSLSNDLHPPQVFFNDEHVGGSRELCKILSAWDREASFSGYDTAFERYEMEIGRVDGPLDERLQFPVPSSVAENVVDPNMGEKTEEVDEQNDSGDDIDLPDGTTLAVVAATRQLMKHMPREDLRYRGKMYHSCFRGGKGVDVLVKLYGLKSRVAAVWFGQILQQRGILHHVTGDHPFKDENCFYRLQPYHQPMVLNSFRLWGKDNSRPAVARAPPRTVAFLAALLDKINTNHTDSKTKLIDYSGARLDPRFQIFEMRVCQLQAVDIVAMDSSTKLAFCINLYNLMVQHAFVKFGVPDFPRQKKKFFQKVRVDLGGHDLSLDDLVHGVLRSNAKPPGRARQPFSPSDNRKSLAMTSVDPRIHFALFSGVKSSPPLFPYTGEAICKELQRAAHLFCTKDENVAINEVGHELVLPKVMDWYTSDFAPSKSELPATVAKYLTGDKKMKLERMITSSKKIKISFFAYDWTANCSTCCSGFCSMKTQTHIMSVFSAAKFMRKRREAQSPPSKLTSKVAEAPTIAASVDSASVSESVNDGSSFFYSKGGNESFALHGLDSEFSLRSGF